MTPQAAAKTLAVVGSMESKSSLDAALESWIPVVDHLRDNILEPRCRATRRFKRARGAHAAMSVSALFGRESDLAA
jgi:hypothetical protein